MVVFRCLARVAQAGEISVSFAVILAKAGIHLALMFEDQNGFPRSRE
ncbi:MAG: hypothetical protein ACTHMK_05895 [Dyella sp.]